MMRIAIAGSGGLAQIFAQYLNDTVHPFIILSREVSFEEYISADMNTNYLLRTSLHWLRTDIRSLSSTMTAKMTSVIPSGVLISSYQPSPVFLKSTLSTRLPTLASADLFQQNSKGHLPEEQEMTLWTVGNERQSIGFDTGPTTLVTECVLQFSLAASSTSGLLTVGWLPSISAHRLVFRTKALT